MAKSSTPRHSKPSRKPATIDLDASQIQRLDQSAKPQPEKTPEISVRPAEPVGDFAKTAAVKDSPADKAMKPEEPVKKIAQSGQSKTEAPSSKPSHSSATKPEATARADMQPQTSEQTKKTQAKSGIFVAALVGAIAGLAGTFIVLSSTTALQNSGWLPASTSKQENSQITALQEEVSALQKMVTSLSQQPAQTQTDSATLNAVQSASDKADNALSQVEKVAASLAALSTDFEKLNNAPNNPAPTDDSRVEALEVKINNFQSLLQQTQSQASQAATTSDNDKALIIEIKNELDALKQQNADRASQPDAAFMIAANALKNAIDRGGSFQSELETFKSAAPAKFDVTTIESHASNGIPTTTQLSNEFTATADKIVATTNQLPADAGIVDQLMASAKNLVSIRPVGNATGTDVGSITARIETALQESDIERALNEWENLPDNAKAVSADFIDRLKARRDTDNLLNRIVADSLKPVQELKSATPSPSPAQ